MKPISLKMQAFGSYSRETVIRFDDIDQRFFLITGDTGAGKSTIFDAVVFALYGEASSSANRKNGTELQSQFAPPEREPYVELCFSEQEQIYTVRRSPRHQRPLKRKSGTKTTKEESERVQLWLPDGTEYPERDVNRKLTEIVGLTKPQFMQVAMIAQGEFMELLRASSDDKKIIFRRLFGTELYQKIADELGRRKKESEKQIAALRTEFQTEAGHIRVPESCPDGKMQAARLQKLLHTDKLTAPDMEAVMEMLESICTWLEPAAEKAELEAAEAKKKKETAQERLTQAVELNKLFQQREQLQAALSQAEENLPALEKAEQLSTELQKAYALQLLYRQYTESKSMELEKQQALETETKQLPELEARCALLQETEKERKLAANAALQQFSAVKERVEQVLDQLKKYAAAKRARETAEKQHAEAAEAEKKKKEALAKLKKENADWQTEADALQGSGEAFERLRNRYHNVKDLQEELACCEKKAAELKAAEENTMRQQQTFEKLRQSVQQADQHYRTEWLCFLQAQAGILASELVDGEPCPVCGSAEHPRPCMLPKERHPLSQEALERLSDTAKKLQKEAETAAGNARSAKDLELEKRRSFRKDCDSLRRHCIEKLPEGGENSIGTELQEILAELRLLDSEKDTETGAETEILTEENVINAAESKNRDASRMAALKRAKMTLDEIQKLQITDGKRLKAAAERSKKLTELIRSGSEQEEKLRAASEAQAEIVLESAKTLSKAEEAESQLRTGLDFATEKEAKESCAAAENTWRTAETAHKQCLDAWTAAQAKENRSRALILQYDQEIPLLKERAAQKRAVYEEACAEQKLTEADWQSLTKQYPEKDIGRLRNAAADGRQRLAKLRGQQQSLQEAIGESERPDIEKRKEKLLRLSEEETRTMKRSTTLRTDLKENVNTRQRLTDRLSERKKAAEEYNRLESLYRQVSGNVSGARMDLETYVQRYYLERILYAANRRFREMSAGQFELRMCSLEQAGAGKNRGLDLMVYSYVTGKEREIRTLSGGESFMAALALALGMADQIQESSSAVQLDIMFIDEGFGSLDDHSRAQAVRVLQEMAGGEKLIGIISHVSELKQEIDDQLIVTKDETGSHVHWN